MSYISRFTVLLYIFVAVVNVSSKDLAHQSTSPLLWAIIGNSDEHLSEQRELGINTRLFRLSWRDMEPFEGKLSSDYIAKRQAELDALRANDYQVILSLGYHDPPHWIHQNHVDSFYVNQYGIHYTGLEILDSGDANFVFNAQLRERLSEYIDLVFAIFGTDFRAVRIGGGRFGELTYANPDFEGYENLYWAFDRNALNMNPVPAWRPGDPSPNNEAEIFLNWYLDQLVDYQNWQIDAVRQNYPGDIMILYPSWSMRPNDFEAAVATNLDGTSSAELNGEVQRGVDFQRQVAAITDPNVILQTTWLDADNSYDDVSDDIARWSPVKYLAYLADQHPFPLQLYGENTGQSSRDDLLRSVEQVHRYNLLGMIWYRESELLSGEYATLDDYIQAIQTDTAP